MEYGNTEDGRKPQKLHIKWSMETPHDDTVDRPDERDEGFWPSTDPDSPGYVGKNPKRPFADQQADATERMAAWERGDWEFVGVIARADIMLPIGGGSFRLFTIRSAGLWGIESDSPDYLREVYEEEKDSLRGELTDLGRRLAEGEAIESDA
jgi:hypothetical protein